MTANFFQYSMENKGLNFTTQAVLVLALHIVLGRIYYKGLNFTTQAVLKYWLCTWNSYGFSETETQISRRPFSYGFIVFTITSGTGVPRT